jgi:hypothetical protein
MGPVDITPRQHPEQVADPFDPETSERCRLPRPHAGKIPDRSRKIDVDGKRGRLGGLPLDGATPSTTQALQDVTNALQTVAAGLDRQTVIPVEETLQAAQLRMDRPELGDGEAVGTPMH